MRVIGELTMRYSDAGSTYYSVHGGWQTVEDLKHRQRISVGDT